MKNFLQQNPSSPKPSDLLQLLLDSEASDVVFENDSTVTLVGQDEPQKLSKKMRPEVYFI